MSDPQRPHGLQPSKLLRPWDFPGKSTGVGCHWFLPSRSGFLAVCVAKCDSPCGSLHQSPHTARGIFLHTKLTGRFPAKYSQWLLLTHRKKKKNSKFQTSLLGADCGTNHELLIAKFRLKLKKLGKTTRPFRYDLNQIPYDYSVEVTNRFKGLDLIDRGPEELWMEVCDTVQEAVIKTIPKKKK